VSVKLSAHISAPRGDKARERFATTTHQQGLPGRHESNVYLQGDLERWRQGQSTAGRSLKLRGSAPDGWLCAAQCGPLLAGGDGGAIIATTSDVFCEYDHTFLNVVTAIASVDEVSEIAKKITCKRVQRASESGFLARLLTDERNNALHLNTSVRISLLDPADTLGVLWTTLVIY
jgi:hypothetical protein